MAKTSSLFRDKKHYKETTYPKKGIYGKDFPAPIDFWYEKTLYGRVDERQDSVYVSMRDDPERFKQIDPSKHIFALNFVADAFFSFQRHMRKAVAAGKLDSKTFLSDLVPESAFVDVDVLYTKYLQTVKSVMVKSFLSLPQHSDDVENFEDFLVKFIEFSEKYSKTLPVTRSSYIRSQYCTPLITGLIIELAKEDHSDDKAKEKWLSSPNYEFYAREARKFGFIVDKNAPWRLVANIMSPRMQKFMNHPDWGLLLKTNELKPDPAYASKGGTWETNSVRTLFFYYYKKSYINDVPELQIFLFEAYKQFYDKFPSFKKLKIEKCSNQTIESLNKIKSKTVLRQEPENMLEMINSYSSLKWHDLYLKIRLLEEGRSMHPETRKRVVSNFITLVDRDKKKDLDSGYPMWYIQQAAKGFPKLTFPVYPSEFGRPTIHILPSGQLNVPPPSTDGPLPARDNTPTPGVRDTDDDA